MRRFSHIVIFFCLMTLVSTIYAQAENKYYFVVKKDSLNLQQGFYAVSEIPGGIKVRENRKADHQPDDNGAFYLHVVKPDHSSFLIALDGSDAVYLAANSELKPLKWSNYLIGQSYSQYLAVIDSAVKNNLSFVPAKNGVFESHKYLFYFKFSFPGYELDTFLLNHVLESIEKEQKRWSGILLMYPSNDSLNSNETGIAPDEMKELKDYKAALSFNPELCVFSNAVIKELILYETTKIYTELKKAKYWRNRIRQFLVYRYYSKNCYVLAIDCNSENLDLIRRFEINFERIASVELIESRIVENKNLQVKFYEAE